MNTYYEKLMMARYGGGDGVLSSFAEYLYQSIITSQTHPTLSTILEGMAISRLRDLLWLEKGIKISYRRKCLPMRIKGSDLNSGSVYNSVRSMLLYDIGMEEKSIAENYRLIRIIKDGLMRDCVMNMIGNEKKRLRTLKN